MLSKEEIKNKEEVLKKISEEQYGDEWFIEKAILSYKSQKEKTYTFFKDEKQENLLRTYNWCQRPCDSNMSLRRFTENGEIEGYMSESLAEYHELVQVDLNEFIFRFVKPTIKENLLLKNQIEQLESDNYESNKIIDTYIEDRQKLIEKLEEDIEKFKKEIKIRPTENNSTIGACGYGQEILAIVKGEKNE